MLELRKETETEETNAEEAERGRFRQPEDEQPWARGGSLAGRAAGHGQQQSTVCPGHRGAAHNHPAEELASADGRGEGNGTLPELCAGADAGAVPQFGHLIWQKKGRRVRSRRP